MSAPDLKPCPFCGETKIDGGYNDHGGFVSICANCDAFGPPASEMSKAAILTAWNTRTDTIPSDPRVKALVEALTEIRDSHIPDQPAAYGGDEAEWARRQHTALRSIAHAALKGAANE